MSSRHPGEHPYEELRPLLFSIAYRMLGSVSEAEDIVQEAFLRLETAGGEALHLANPKAYLSTIVTRLCIDYLRSARVQREEYVGEWLPEPLLTDIADPAESADSLSQAFLVLLESLSPVERAVFLLRDVFSYDYAEIARVVGKTEDNCRQLAVRSRRHVEARKPRFAATRERREALAERFFAACEEGDLSALTELLAADVVLHGDGGGKAPALARPLHGRDRVSGVLVKLVATAHRLGLHMRRHQVNGHPGAAFYDEDGRLVNVISLDIAEDSINAIRSIVNPEKLAHAGPTADLKAILRRGGRTAP